VSLGRENEEPLIGEDLERGAAIGDNGHRHTDLRGRVVQEPVEIVIFDLGVREQQDQVVGAMFGDDPLGRGPAADAAVLQNPNVS